MWVTSSHDPFVRVSRRQVTHEHRDRTWSRSLRIRYYYTHAVYAHERER